MQAENFTLFTHSVGGNKFRPTVEIQSPRYRLAKFISPTEAVLCKHKISPFLHIPLGEINFARLSKSDPLGYRLAKFISPTEAVLCK